MTNYPAGSTWKKWDLLVHTPASVVHDYPGTEDKAWEAFLLDLEALPADFKVIGINDYIFIDGYERARKAKAEQGRLKNIDLLLPVVELRLDKIAGVVIKEEDGSYWQSGWNRINLHVSFAALAAEKAMGAKFGQGRIAAVRASLSHGNSRRLSECRRLRWMG